LNCREAEEVHIVLNGREYEAPAAAAVLGLLETLGLAPGRVAVELNGRVLRREDFGRSSLRDGDRLEIVQFVGGG
jgi:thiamine biosynthesis protein ThiS